VKASRRIEEGRDPRLLLGTAGQVKLLSHYGATKRHFAVARVTLRIGKSSGAEPQHERN
jgi:hypothetical protein